MSPNQAPHPPPTQHATQAAQTPQTTPTSPTPAACCALSRAAKAPTTRTACTAPTRCGMTGWLPSGCATCLLAIARRPRCVRALPLASPSSPAPAPWPCASPPQRLSVDNFQGALCTYRRAMELLGAGQQQGGGTGAHSGRNSAPRSDDECLGRGCGDPHGSVVTSSGSARRAAGDRPADSQAYGGGGVTAAV